MKMFPLHADSFAVQSPNDEPVDTGAPQLRRSASAIYAIARIVGNSIRNRQDGVEPMILPPQIEAGLLDAVELIALALECEASHVDMANGCDRKRC